MFNNLKNWSDENFIMIVAVALMTIFIFNALSALRQSRARKYIESKMDQLPDELWSLAALPDPETRDICVTLMKQLIKGLELVENQMRTHAEKHAAILYRCEVDAPYHVTNINLYGALDALTQKFHRVYGKEPHLGTFQRRNKFNIGIESKAFPGHIVYLYDLDPEQIKEAMKRHRFDDHRIDVGCKLFFTLSIITPYTSKSYWYKNYC